MRIGGELGLGLRGGGSGGGMVMAMRRGAEDGGGGGCSTSRGSSFGDSPLPSFVRSGGPRTQLEPDGLPTPSSNASRGPREEEDRALEGVKEEGWVQFQGATKNPNSAGECQDRRHRSGAVLFNGKKSRKQRPVSLDFGCPGVDRSSAIAHSLGFLASGVGVVNKGSGVSSHGRSGVLTSPGAPNYSQHGAATVGYQQGWSSERVPLHSNGHRRHPGSSMALPYHNAYARALPSKWEDAERWIFSPNPSDALGRTSVPQHRRPKSKSGPLGPTGRSGGPYSSVSSSASLLGSGRAGDVTVSSPFLSGVLLPEHVCGGGNHTAMDIGGASSGDSSNDRRGRSGQANGGHPAMWSTMVSQQLDRTIQSSQSLPTSQESRKDEHVESAKDSATSSATVILRKDVATQTSPDLSRSSSPNMRPSFSRSLSSEQVKELESCFSKLEIRDVQMDDRVTLTRWSKKHVTRGCDKNLTNIIEWKKKTLESKSSAWEVTETAKCVSKIEGEQAKLTAWENMQKAKAEAAIQKLVMKLEKKKSYSLERIFNTLRSAHRKTQVVRSTTSKHDQQISMAVKRTSHLSKNGQMSSLSGCFTCHAF